MKTREAIAKAFIPDRLPMTASHAVGRIRRTFLVAALRIHDEMPDCEVRRAALARLHESQLLTLDGLAQTWKDKNANKVESAVPKNDGAAGTGSDFESSVRSRDSGSGSDETTGSDPDGAQEGS